MRKISAFFIIRVYLPILLILSTGCAGSASETETVPMLFAFDTYITIDIRGMEDNKRMELVGGSFDICRQYEALFSKTIPDSDVSRLNSSQGLPVEIHEDTFRILRESLFYSQWGGFDITVKPLADLWGIGGEPSDSDIPPRNEIIKALASVGYENIVLFKDSQAALKNNTRIDLGGIAKGFAADRIWEYLTEQGCTSAVIDLGGNAVAVGERPGNNPWRVGIQMPFAKTGELAGVLTVSDASVVTSGSYQRYFRKNGVIYHHIFDPLTGRPAGSGLISVTIVSDKSTEADALSTACFVLGLDKGMALLESLDGPEGIFITEDYKIYTTRGIGDSFEPYLDME